MTSVSIVIPIYNAEKYLSQCLDSLIKQSLRDIEIICVDDGSTDSSPIILDTYRKNNDNITIISKQNTGYGDSVNTGIEQSNGKYIGIIEPDDYVEPDMFKILFENAKKHDLDISRCTFFYYNEDSGEEIEEKFPFMIKNRVYAPLKKKETFYQQPTDWANIYNREFLIKNNIKFLTTPGASYQDTSFLFKAYACANRFMIDSRPLHHYRINEGSSVKQNSSKVFCICTEYEEIWRFTREHELTDRLKYVITQLQFYGYKWNCMRLNEEKRMLFIKKWAEDLSDLKSKGFIRRFDYLPSDYKIIKQLLKHGKEYTHSSQFGLVDSKEKKARNITSKIGFIARWFVRIRM